MKHNIPLSIISTVFLLVFMGLLLIGAFAPELIRNTAVYIIALVVSFLFGFMWIASAAKDDVKVIDDLIIDDLIKKTDILVKKVSNRAKTE